MLLFEYIQDGYPVDGITHGFLPISMLLWGKIPREIKFIIFHINDLNVENMKNIFININ
jgi:hypothetical protein